MHGGLALWDNFVTPDDHRSPSTANTNALNGLTCHCEPEGRGNPVQSTVPSDARGLLTALVDPSIRLWQPQDNLLPKSDCFVPRIESGGPRNDRLLTALVFITSDFLKFY
jgi:hypothetical protein